MSLSVLIKMQKGDEPYYERFYYDGDLNITVSSLLERLNSQYPILNADGKEVDAIMEMNRDVTRRDILYGVLKRMDEVIDSISNTVSTKDFLVRDIIYDLDRLEEAKLALVAVLEDMQQEESKN